MQYSFIGFYLRFLLGQCGPMDLCRGNVAQLVHVAQWIFVGAVAQLVHLIDERHQQPLTDLLYDDLQDEFW
jgi:hypothetical protein